MIICRHHTSRIPTNNHTHRMINWLNVLKGWNHTNIHAHTHTHTNIHRSVRRKHTPNARPPTRAQNNSQHRPHLRSLQVSVSTICVVFVTPCHPGWLERIAPPCSVTAVQVTYQALAWDHDGCYMAM